MLGGFFRVPEEEIDKIINRVLNDKRVDLIATRVADKLVDRVTTAVLDRLSEGLKALDKED